MFEDLINETKNIILDMNILEDQIQNKSGKKSNKNIV